MRKLDPHWNFYLYGSIVLVKTIINYLHWISNTMSLLVLYFCSYVATQRSKEMFLLTFRILSSCPLEETSCSLLFISLYLHLISQGGLQSAEQSYGPTVSSSLTVNLPLLSLGSGSIDILSGWSTNTHSILQDAAHKIRRCTICYFLIHDNNL